MKLVLIVAVALGAHFGSADEISSGSGSGSGLELATTTTPTTSVVPVLPTPAGSGSQSGSGSGTVPLYPSTNGGVCARTRIDPTPSQQTTFLTHYRILIRFLSLPQFL